jgi:hypothetical protein
MCLALDKVGDHPLQLSVSGETLRRWYYVSRSLLDVNWIAPQGPRTRWNRDVALYAHGGVRKPRVSDIAVCWFRKFRLVRP